MKVYVAGSIRDIERVKKVIEGIENAGHVITFDWTSDEGEIRDEAEGKTWDNSHARAAEIAQMERRGVWDADVAVLCGHEKCMGAFIEIGMALCDEKEVLVLPGCPRDSIFWYLPGVVKCETLDQVLEQLAWLDNRKQEFTRKFGLK